MGRGTGVIAATQGVVQMRSSHPIAIVSPSSLPPAFAAPHQRQSLPTASADPSSPSSAAAAFNAGVLRQRLKLHCSTPVRRLATLSAFPYCCSSDSTPSLATTSGSRPRSFDSSAPSSSGLLNGWLPGNTRKMSQDRLHLMKAAADEDVNGKPIGTRKIVEHVVLFKMKDDLTAEQEKEMLDSLWSLQYQIKNMLCTTVGRLAKKTPEGYTHGLFSRFPNKQALDDYMESPVRWRVAQDLGKLVLDFEGDVEDDIETIFRRGDDFQEGVEHFSFFRFKDKVSSDIADKFFKKASSLPAQFGELVQLTVGVNFESQSKGSYSHGLVARLPSEEAHAEYEKFLQGDPSWVELTELLESSQTLVANFVVSPIGKTVM